MSHGLVIIWLLISSLLPKNAVLGDAIQNSSATNTITRLPSPYPTSKPAEKPLSGYPTPYLTRPPITPELRTAAPISPTVLTPRPSGFRPPLLGDKPKTGSLSGQTNVNEKLTQERLKKCQEVEAKIKSEGASGITSLTNAYASMSGVIAGVNTYYKNKLVPAGITVANYDSLFASMQNKQQIFLTDIQTAKTNLNSFSCTGTAPGKQITTVTQDIKKSVQSVKDIKSAIRELVAAIKNAAQTFNDTSTTASESTK